MPIQFSGHLVELDQVRILDKEPKCLERGIKEAIEIRVNHPTLNSDRGWYKLPPVWDNLVRSHVTRALLIVNEDAGIDPELICSRL